MANELTRVNGKYNNTTPSHDVWQLCPKCNGTGEMMITNFGYVVSTNANCDLCWGKKIISTITGQPPV